MVLGVSGEQIPHYLWCVSERGLYARQSLMRLKRLKAVRLRFDAGRVVVIYNKLLVEIDCKEIE